MKIHDQNAALLSAPPPPAICPERTIHYDKIQSDSENVCNDFAALHRIETHTNEQQMYDTKFVVSDRETRLPKALGIYLSQRFDPIGLRVWHWGERSFWKWSIDLRVGPAIVRCWSGKGRPVYKTVSWKEGICLFSTLRDHRLFSKRMTLMISGIVRAPKISITCNITICGMLQVAGPAYLACKRGDWPLLRKMLGNGEVKISDSTGYGETLLHVCLL